MGVSSVSVIIPVYNCDEYLENCILSVLQQSYTNLEILLIDDGSYDRSAEICDMFVEKDRRIRAFHIANGGVSNARNYGLKHARGTYIQFVDSDDSIAKDMTERMVTALEEANADMAVCGYNRITKHITRRDPMPDPEGVYTSTEYLIGTLKDPKGFFYGVVWNKLFKRAVIEEHGLCFNQKITLGEDFVFTLDYLPHIEKVAVLSQHLYRYYYANSGSLSRYEKTYKVMRKEFENRLQIFEKYKNCFVSHNIYSEYEDEVYKYWYDIYLNAWHAPKLGIPHFSKLEIEQWRQLVMGDEEVSKCAQNISAAELRNWRKQIQRKRLIAQGKKPMKWLIGIVKKWG